MEVLGRWPIDPTEPNPPATAQPHAGSWNTPPGVSQARHDPHRVTLPVHTARGHPRIVRVRSWVESLAQGQQTSADASLYGSEGLAGFFGNLVMRESFEKSHLQRRTLWWRHGQKSTSNFFYRAT